MFNKWTPALCFIIISTCSPGALADYGEGYQWAEKNKPENFDECARKFGPSEEEDGCNDYVQALKFGEKKKYGPDNCDEDCNGYEAGYRWAEENGISDEYACESKTPSFVEGCQQFVRETS